VALVISSSDRYSDLWPTYFALLERFWPDCPFHRYLVSNTKGLDDRGITNILVGPDACWSDTMLKALPRITEEYILIWGEDLFPCAPVNTQRIMEFCRFAVENVANYVRLHAKPRPDRPLNDLLGVVSPGTIYRASTTVNIWKRDVLLDLLRPGETGAVFESNGSERSDAYPGFYSSRNTEVHFINGVIKGKWEQRAVKKLRELGVDVDQTCRKTMTRYESLLFKALQIRSDVLQLFPAAHRRGIRSFFRRGRNVYKYDYSVP
jgi:hypothetical protein